MRKFCLGGYPGFFLSPSGAAVENRIFRMIPHNFGVRQTALFPPAYWCLVTTRKVTGSALINAVRLKVPLVTAHSSQENPPMNVVNTFTYFWYAVFLPSHNAKHVILTLNISQCASIDLIQGQTHKLMLCLTLKVSVYARQRMTFPRIAWCLWEKNKTHFYCHVHQIRPWLAAVVFATTIGALDHIADRLPNAMRVVEHDDQGVPSRNEHPE